MKDLIERFLSHIIDAGVPMIEVEIEGEIFSGVLTGELADLVSEMREAVASDDPELQ